MRATIYKSTGSWYLVKTEHGDFLRGRIKGKFKIDREITSTNPIAVGDWVEIEPENEIEKTAVIHHIEKRSNYLVRVSPHNKNQKHIVAANIDQCVLIATIKEPKTSTGFIDRFLISCEVYHIPAVIVFNKSDLLDSEELSFYQYLHGIYTDIGYPVYLISITQKQNLEVLNDLLSGKVSLLTGHSGVGKSSFINHLLPNHNLKVQDVSDWSGKGMHTTTFAERYDLPDGGAIIDTPGIKELGIVDVSRAELGGYFPEIKRIAGSCKYNNCQHFNEPDCAVKAAVKNKLISEERYLNYAKIYDTIDDKNY